jgi:hypothetical protein
VNQKTKELWVIPAIVAIVTGILLGTLFMFLGPWLAGTPIHVSLSFAWMTAELSARLPIWVTLCVIVAAAVAVGLFIRQRARTAEEKAQRVALFHSLEHSEVELEKLKEAHAMEIQKLKQTPPIIEVVWTPGTCWWGKDLVNGEERIYLRGMVHLSTRNVRVDLTLVQAQVNENAPGEFGPLFVRLGRVLDIELFVETAPPIGRETEDLMAQITFIDNRNRRYTIPEQVFRWNTATTKEGEVAPVGRPEYPEPGRFHWE